MSKLFGLVVIVLSVWVAAEVFNKGLEGAFGGILAGGSGESATAEASSAPVRPQTIPQRSGERVEQAHAEAAARREQLLGD